MGDCRDPNELNIDDPRLINRVKNSKVRIITVAFGRDADPNLGMLAEISNGKVYFVHDGSGLGDINDVFTDSDTYQPAVPSRDAEIVVLQKSYFNQTFINDEFVIDDTLGRDVKFAIDVLSGMPTEVSIFYSNGTMLFNRNGGITDRTFVNFFPIL